MRRCGGGPLCLLDGDIVSSSRNIAAVLRDAFNKMVKDPEFLAEAMKSTMDMSPSTGEEAQKIAVGVMGAPGAGWLPSTTRSVKA